MAALHAQFERCTFMTDLERTNYQPFGYSAHYYCAGGIRKPKLNPVPFFYRLDCDAQAHVRYLGVSPCKLGLSVFRVAIVAVAPPCHRAGASVGPTSSVPNMGRETRASDCPASRAATLTEMEMAQIPSWDFETWRFTGANLHSTRS